ncbi:hypothetical protein [Pantanalinema sp. GBBB05]|uniref:hypothetical protein n=1 Tax=Pantanalinema sp. GBBB05 TaxID=2604139 RepID=UPI003D81986E
MKKNIWQSLLLLAVSAVACQIAVAQPTPASTALPMTISTGEGMFSLTVPDTDTTRPAYGGRLRVYDVHIAKMFEVTHFMCASGRLSPGTIWSYSAGGGSVNMGNFTISCKLANDIAIAYGLGQPEQTPIYFSAEESGGSSRTMNVPILNITGGKVDQWMRFTNNFRPSN